MIPKGKRAITLINAVRAVANNEAVITPDALRRLMPHLAQASGGIGADLTAREREVLRLLVAGKSTARWPPSCLSRRPPRETIFNRS